MTEREHPVSRRPVTIVMYHSIHPEVDRYTISPQAFARQIRFLKRHYGILRLSEVPAALARPEEGPRRVVITFDDAYLDFAERAYPVLAELDVPATVFVPTGYLGRTNGWDASLPDYRSKALMTRDHLGTLWQTGLVDFGSHTVDHVRLSRMDREEVVRQVRDSKAFLEDVLGVPVTTFSYPYGQLADVSDDAVEAVREAGYQAAVTTHWGAWNTADQVLRLRRVYFEEDDEERTLLRKASGLYDWRTAKEKVGYAMRKVGKRLSG